MRPVSSAQSLTHFKQMKWLLDKKRNLWKEIVGCYLLQISVVKHLLCIQRCSGKLIRKYHRFEVTKQRRSFKYLPVKLNEALKPKKNGVRDSLRQHTAKYVQPHRAASIAVLQPCIELVAWRLQLVENSARRKRFLGPPESSYIKTDSSVLRQDPLPPSLTSPQRPDTWHPS